MCQSVHDGREYINWSSSDLLVHRVSYTSHKKYTKEKLTSLNEEEMSGATPKPKAKRPSPSATSMSEHLISLVIDNVLIVYDEAAAAMKPSKHKNYQEQVELITSCGCEDAGSKGNRPLLQTRIVDRIANIALVEFKLSRYQ